MSPPSSARPILSLIVVGAVAGMSESVALAAPYAAAGSGGYGPEGTYECGQEVEVFCEGEAIGQSTWMGWSADNEFVSGSVATYVDWTLPGGPHSLSGNVEITMAGRSCHWAIEAGTLCGCGIVWRLTPDDVGRHSATYSGAAVAHVHDPDGEALDEEPWNPITTRFTVECGGGEEPPDRGEGQDLGGVLGPGDTS
ncbi:MAG: hypothetical protein ACE5O2_12275 [Armatimonadota bacterium]